MRNIVVIGAGGFIGSHLVERLARGSQVVLAVDKRPIPEWSNVCYSSNVKNVFLDASDAYDRKNMFANAEVVYNLTHANVEYSAYCAGVRKFIGIDLLVRRFCPSSLNVRFGYIYGPRQPYDWLTDFCKSVIKEVNHDPDKDVYVFGTPRDTKLKMLYIDDCIQALTDLMSQTVKKNHFIISGWTPTTVGRVCANVAGISEKNVRLSEMVREAQGELWLQNDPVLNLEHTTMDTGLRRLYDWVGAVY